MRCIIFAFHFNRGEYLENLVASARRFAPHIPLIIFDDGSTDEKTVQILKKLSESYEIVSPSINTTSEYWTGGLHGNMTRALELAHERGTEFAIMIQDDMQFVREITDADFERFSKGFSRQGASFVITGGFRKSPKGKRNPVEYVEVSPGVFERFYENEPDARAKRINAYADTGIFSVPLFREQLGTLQTGENSNQEVLAGKDLRLAALGNPIMHFMPMPLSFRGKKRNFIVQFADHLAGAGVHPIRVKNENLALASETPPPFAEDALEAPSLRPVRFWSYRGGKDNLRSCKGLRRYLAYFVPK